MTAAIYCRLSREDEEKQSESESIQNQKSMLIKYALDKGWDIYNIYCDEDYSGIDRERPAFRQLIADAEARQFDIVLVKTQSRFTRDMELVEKYIHGLFAEWGIRFVATVDNVDTDIKGNKKARQINGLVNEWYLEDMSDNIRSVLDSRRENGFHIGAFALYGYQKDPKQKGRLVIDEEAAAVVREVFTLFSQGYGKTAIARLLNDRGIPNPTEYKRRHGLRYRQPTKKNSTLWKYSAIADMLENEIYIGNMVQGRQVKISYKSKKCLHQDRNNWVVVEDTHEPLIDAESFRKVRMLVNSRKRTRSRTYDFLLKGLIFCHECGYPLGVLNRPNAKGEETLYFVCRTYQRFTKNSACTTHYIKEKTVTDAVIAKVREVCEDYLTAEALLPAAEKAVKEASQESKTAAEISALQNKSANLTEHLDRMYTDRLSGLLPEEDFQRIFTRIKDERAQLEERIKELQQQQKNPISQTERAKDLVQRYLDTAYANRELLVSLIERIELTAAREIIVKFRFAELQQTG